MRRALIFRQTCGPKRIFQCSPAGFHRFRVWWRPGVRFSEGSGCGRSKCRFRCQVRGLGLWCEARALDSGVTGFGDGGAEVVWGFRSERVSCRVPRGLWGGQGGSAVRFSRVPRGSKKSVACCWGYHLSFLVFGDRDYLNRLYAKLVWCYQSSLGRGCTMLYQNSWER